LRPQFDLRRVAVVEGYDLENPIFSLALSAVIQLNAACPVTAFTSFPQFPAFQAERNFVP